VFVESGGTWSQQAELTASDGAAYDNFGWSVALSSSTVVVGAPHHMVGSNITQGAAYVFAESGGTWNQQAELTSSDGVAYDYFGSSVAIGGSSVVAGPLSTRMTLCCLLQVRERRMCSSKVEERGISRRNCSHRTARKMTGLAIPSR